MKPYCALDLANNIAQATMVGLPYAWILFALCLAGLSDGSLNRCAITKNKETAYRLAELKTVPVAEVADVSPSSYGELKESMNTLPLSGDMNVEDFAAHERDRRAPRRGGKRIRRRRRIIRRIKPIRKRRPRNRRGGRNV